MYLALGDFDSARWACRKLEGIADSFGSQATAAGAVYLRGTMDAAIGHAAEATEGFYRAAGMFRGLEQPYDEALANEACAVASADPAGVPLLEQAIAVYARLGTSADERRAREHLVGLSR